MYMAEGWFRQHPKIRFILLNLCVAIAYATAARLSLEFTTLAGAVASIWLPSGLTLGLVLLLGNRVFLGIILGSFFIVGADILSRDPPISILALLFINIFCALANIVQPLSATYFIKKYTSEGEIFRKVKSVVIYIIAAIISPIFSATIGLTSIALAGRIPWDDYSYSWFTWWLASALAHLIFTPTILLWRDFSSKKKYYNFQEIVGSLLIFFLISWVIFIQYYPLAYLLLLLLLWTVFRYGSFIASLLVSVVSITAIFSTNQGLGLFLNHTQNESLLLLQSFMGVFALTSLLLSAAIDEKSVAQRSLKNALENSEKLVMERTKELRQSEMRLKEANLELQKLVNIDGLTKIANRRCFDDCLNNEWERLLREQEPLSLLLFDVDYFKNYNDYYGHQMGDDCLIRIAEVVSKILHRTTDLIARYGGEEFAVILPNTDEKGAQIVAEKIRLEVMNLGIEHEKSGIANVVTISVGAASLFPNLLQNAAVLLNQADQALYVAKNRGRNCTVFFPAD